MPSANCSASSEHSGTFTCDRAFDADSGTDWATQGEGVGSWIQSDFGATYRVTRFEYQQRNGNEDNRQITLSFSDGSSQTFSLARHVVVVSTDGDGCGAGGCSECEGDCDIDSDCAGDLVCFQRTASSDTVPGCASTGYRRTTSDWDYCYDASSTANDGIQSFEIEPVQTSFVRIVVDTVYTSVNNGARQINFFTTQGYVGLDPYHFTPAGNPRRPYICDGQTGLRPVWHLIGFFERTACAAIRFANWNRTHCNQFATISPTTAGPTTSEPTTSGPTTTEPTTSEPTTSEPTTSAPTTSAPTTAEPTTSEPTTSDPTTSEPTTSESTTPEPTTAEPTTSEPTAVGDVDAGAGTGEDDNSSGSAASIAAIIFAVLVAVAVCAVVVVRTKQQDPTGRLGGGKSSHANPIYVEMPEPAGFWDSQSDELGAGGKSVCPSAFPSCLAHLQRQSLERRVCACRSQSSAPSPPLSDHYHPITH